MFSTVERYNQCCGGCSVLLRDTISGLEHDQYFGEISSVLLGIRSVLRWTLSTVEENHPHLAYYLRSACGGCSVLWKVFITVEVVQYTVRDIFSSLEAMSKLEGFQYY